MRLREYKKKRPRIEIVPMIDTIFFLLVYFMVASLTMTRMNTRKVDLPESVTAASHPPHQVLVTLTKDDVCFLDQAQVPENGITTRLRTRLHDDPNVTVILNCDKDQPVAGFNRLYNLVKLSNPSQVMIATTPVAPGSIPR